MIITGDASGDLHGARLVQAMQRKDENLFFFGIGGNGLKAAGVRILVDTSALSVVGATEIFSKLHIFLGALMLTRTLLKVFHPDLLILIDFPGFNLPVSAIAKKYGVRIFYYISPQVWAWRSGRVKKLRKRIDHMAVILPFEADFFERHRVPVTFVGHPILDAYPDMVQRASVPERNGNRVIGLLPGSRDREVSRHLPVMLDAADILVRKMGDLRFVVSVAPSVGRQVIEKMIRKHASHIDCTPVDGGVDKTFKQCEFSVIASGTATLEAALFAMPMVIIYRVSPITYWLGRALVHVDHIGLVNLIAGKGVVPELIQRDASAEKIADAVCRMLKDGQGLERLRGELFRIKDKLGGAGASERAADIALAMV